MARVRDAIIKSSVKIVTVVPSESCDMCAERVETKLIYPAYVYQLKYSKAREKYFLPLQA